MIHRWRTEVGGSRQTDRQVCLELGMRYAPPPPMLPAPAHCWHSSTQKTHSFFVAVLHRAVFYYCFQHFWNPFVIWGVV